MPSHIASNKYSWLLDLIAAVLLLSFALIVAYPRWRAEMDWRDEGLLAYGAVRVAQGEVPHRDFVSVQPPLSYYVVATVFKVWGTSLATMRGLGLSLFLMLPLLLYGIARSLKNGPLISACAAAPACVLGLPYVYFVPLAAWQGIASSLATVLLFIASVLTAQKWLAVPAGIFAAMSLLLRHDQAAYTVVAIFILAAALSFARDDLVTAPFNFSRDKLDCLKQSSFKRRSPCGAFGKGGAETAATKHGDGFPIMLRRVLFLWLGGILIIALPAFIIWWRIGAVPETFKQLVVFPVATYRKTSSLPFPKLTAGHSLAERFVVLLYYLPLIIQAIAAIYLAQRIWRRQFRFREAALMFLIAWSALFYLQVMVRSDQTHLLLTLPPFFLLTAFMISIGQQAIGDKRILKFAVGGAAAIITIAYLWAICSILLPDVSHATEPLALDRGGVRVAQARVTNNFIKGLQTYIAPNRSMLALPYQPMFYFLAERRNPTRWNYLWPGDQTPENHQRFIEQAERDPPALILLSDEDELADYAPVILDYIKSHYDRSGIFGKLVIYVGRDAE